MTLSEELHDDEGGTAVGAKVIDGADLGVARCGGCARLLRKALDSRRIPGRVGENALEGDISRQAGVAGAVHLAHASPAESALDSVAVGECRACGMRRIRQGATSESLCVVKVVHGQPLQHLSKRPGAVHATRN